LIKPVYRLDRRAINPSNFERQKVKYHLQVYQPQVVAAMKMYHRYSLPGFQKLDETLIFMENILKFWNLHDVCNTTQHVHQRLEDKRQYTSAADTRLVWLEKELPEYVIDWKDQAEPHQFLTDETYNALIFTCKSTAACIRYLLGLGFRYVLTRNFSTDAIERFFGSVRAQCGANDTPNPANCIDSINRIVRTSMGYASINGNVPLENDSAEKQAYLLERQTTPKKPAVSSFLKEVNLSEAQLEILDEFNFSPGMNKVMFLFITQLNP